MKKLILTLTAAAMLTSCSAKNNAATETSKNGKSESSAAVEVNVENGTTAAVNADTENGTAAAANAKKAASSETDVSDTDALSVDGEEGQSPIMEIFEASELPDEDAHEEELTAIDKLNKKYGREFEVVSRNVCWESWGEEVIDEDGTVRYENSESDPSEPLSIYYNMRDANGLEFGAYVKEDTDNITYDNYLYTQYKDLFDQDVGAALQRLLPACRYPISQVCSSDHSQFHSSRISRAV